MGGAGPTNGCARFILWWIESNRLIQLIDVDDCFHGTYTYIYTGDGHSVTRSTQVKRTKTDTRERGRKRTAKSEHNRQVYCFHRRRSIGYSDLPLVDDDKCRHESHCIEWERDCSRVFFRE